MADHKIEPVRKGRLVVCRVCGCSVQFVRHRVRKAFWRHESGASLYNLRRAQIRRNMNI